MDEGRQPDTSTAAGKIASHSPAPLRRVGAYDLIRLIGRGSTASVFEAVCVADRTPAAVKILHPHLADDRVPATRFLCEGRTLYKISHPNVVRVIDTGDCNGVPYLVMPLVDGEDLSDYLRRLHPMPLHRIVEVMLPVVDAVATVHEAGLIHRDLKPSNIRLSRAENGICAPKVLDFGISKWRESDATGDLTRPGETIGTLNYMAPERLRFSKGTDERGDVYSLGVILYECATGRRPFWGVTNYELMHGILTADVTPPTFHRPDLPAEFDNIVLRAIRRVPSERYASARELGVALSRLAARSEGLGERKEAIAKEAHAVGSSGFANHIVRHASCRMVRAHTLDVSVWLHAVRDPPRDEWNEACAVFADHMRRGGAVGSSHRAFVVTDGGAPNAVQRRRLFVDVLHELPVTTAVVTTVLRTSVVKRGIATAIRWFSSGHRFFEPEQIQAALAHIDLSAGDFGPIWHALASMQKDMVRNATLALVAAQLGLSPISPRAAGDDAAIARAPR